MHGVPPAPARAWLFQGNPARWPVLERLAAGEPITSWNVLRSLELIAPGDGALLWVSGPYAAVHAVGVVTSAPVEGEPGGWPDRQRGGRPRHRVGLDLTPLPHPVTRAELRQDPRFAGAAILRAPRTANPFPVSPSEWAAVLERLP